MLVDVCHDSVFWIASAHKETADIKNERSAGNKPDRVVQVRAAWEVNRVEVRIYSREGRMGRSFTDNSMRAAGILNITFLTGISMTLQRLHIITSSLQVRTAAQQGLILEKS